MRYLAVHAAALGITLAGCQAWPSGDACAAGPCGMEQRCTEVGPGGDPECWDQETCPVESGPVAIAKVVEPATGSRLAPGETVELDAGACLARDPDSLTYRWYLKEVPQGSAVRLQPESNPDAQGPLESESHAARASFVVDLHGRYAFCLHVCDDQGECTRTDTEGDCRSDHCLGLQTDFRGDIHVQLTWDTPASDLDLHYIRVQGRYGAADDCHSNSMAPDYCAAGDPWDDPRLDTDDRNGYGPENVNHDRPCADAYRVWVTYADGRGDMPTLAKIRVYTLGNEIANVPRMLDARGCHWLAGMVIWSGNRAAWSPGDNGDQYVCGTENPEL